MLERTLELIGTKRYNILKTMLSAMQAADIALLLEELNQQETILVFRLLPKELAAEVFVYIENDKQELLIKNFSDAELENVFNDLFMDDIVDIIEEMPANAVKRILEHTDNATRSTINQLLQYADESAGSIMTTELVGLKAEMSVKQAFDKIRETGLDSETIYTCYVTTGDRRLIGEISVKTLLLSEPTDKIKDIMEQNVISVKTTDDREFVANQMKKYDFITIPVVDFENRLVGIVTIDDALDVIGEETEEDFALMAGVQPSEESYFKTSVFVHAKNRIGWLLVLMLAATLTGVIVNSFKDLLIALPVLISFIPLIMDTGGNCGAQSSTVIIRALAVNDVCLKDVFRVIFKEIRISLVVGAVLAVVNSVAIYVIYSNSTQFNALEVAAVVGASMIITVLLSKIIGATLPLAAVKLKLDPVIMATPLITTIVDACSLIVFFLIVSNTIM